VLKRVWSHPTPRNDQRGRGHCQATEAKTEMMAMARQQGDSIAREERRELKVTVKHQSDSGAEKKLAKHRASAIKFGDSGTSRSCVQVFWMTWRHRHPNMCECQLLRNTRAPVGAYWSTESMSTQFLGRGLAPKAVMITHCNLV
jgi:hypothetical protein